MSPADEQNKELHGCVAAGHSRSHGGSAAPGAQEQQRQKPHPGMGSSGRNKDRGCPLLGTAPGSRLSVRTECRALRGGCRSTAPKASFHPAVPAWGRGKLCITARPQCWRIPPSHTGRVCGFLDFGLFSPATNEAAESARGGQLSPYLPGNQGVL